MDLIHGNSYSITLETPNRHCCCALALRDRGIHQYSFVDLREQFDGSIRHVVKVTTDQLTASTLSIDAEGVNGHVIVWLDSQHCHACNILVSHDVLAITGESLNGHNVLYHFLVPEFQTFQKIMTRFEARAIPVKIVEVCASTAKNTILTPKQERALILAKELGYFHYPRSINQAALAQQVGVASSTLSEHLRRATQRLVEHYITPF